MFPHSARTMIKFISFAVDGPLLQLIHMPILPNLHYLKKNLVSEKNSIIHLLKISHQKNTVLVYGYGAYGYSTSAFYSPILLNLVEKGAVFVVAHVRGGGEKGEDWHMAGFKQTKPNTWKDLNSTAQWLIDNEYTSPAHLVP